MFHMYLCCIGVFRASAPEISVNWTFFGTWAPFPILLPLGIRYSLIGRPPSFGARHLHWNYEFYFFSIIFGVQEMY